MYWPNISLNFNQKIQTEKKKIYRLNVLITRKPLFKLNSYYLKKLMIGSIFRDNKWQVAVGNTHIRDNERAIVVCMSQHLKDVQKLFL